MGKNAEQIEQLIPGTVLNNQQLCEIFKCSPQGGMRKSNTTKTLVLITHHVESVYSDVWDNDILYYTGMGQKGDQSLDFMQNKTLNEIESNGISVHYFEVFKDKEYTYSGHLVRAGDPYQTNQFDINQTLRKVWVFPLKLIENKLPITIFSDYKKAREKQVHKYKADKLLDKIKKQNKKPGKRDVITLQYIRSPELAELIKRRANGKCDLCQKPAPFTTKDKIPYLECHHIIWLSQGGEDSIENTVALCPNCHRKMHIVKADNDIDKLKTIASLRAKEVSQKNE
jgi:5-methylcytosine-specific restriction enzyme A